MGDTGSLMVGMVSVVMAIKFIEVNRVVDVTLPHIYSVPSLAVAILIGPIFDTLRVFTLRIVYGGSPFVADRNHVHHRILRLGFNHMQTTLILAVVNIISIVLALVLSKFGNTVVILIIAAGCMLFKWTVTFLIRCKERNSYTFKNLFA